MEDKNKDKKTKIIVKAPTQERSRQTVATILEACSRLLISEGFYTITTDKIAKEAGVSIGSLYQFFGNKESVVQAVVKNMIEEDKRLISEEIQKVANMAPDDRLMKMIDIALNVIRRNSQLRAKLTTVQYYVADSGYVSDFIHYYQDIIAKNLPQIPGRDMQKVAYVVVNAFIGLVNTMSIENAESLYDEQIISEIRNLFFSYATSTKTNA